MRRRAFFGILTALSLAAVGHTPYRQWAVYRKKNLLILTSKAEPGTFALGKKLAERLAIALPASRARVARAPDNRRVASLLSSKQLDVALLSPATARRLAEGRPPYADHGPIALRTLLLCDDLVLVCRDDFPAHHAYLVTKALLGQARVGFTTALPGRDAKHLPALHQGAAAYRDNQPQPPAPAKQESTRPVHHIH